MSDYNFLMESRLSSEQMQVVNHLGRIASGQGLNLYLVGGAVRDLVHGLPAIRDLDFVVEGNPQKILRGLEVDSRPGASRGDAPPAGPPIERLVPNRRLNSSEIYFVNTVRAELAESRNEVYPKPGRPPQIEPATIFEDLRRRDFSANAMAISLHPNSRGLLLDPTNGAADIAQRELRVLHSRSFLEDPSRIYRLLRLAERLEFKPEERTRNHLQASIENRLWEQLSPEQQGVELRAILQEENPGRMLK
ncbi:MAG TPA: CCA tRNA nucleotidyltransferase, partial [Terriglobia bacterium]|nr:CCA tRNA nucleotidyltransferase [Terriglobia bacterium]